MKKAICIKNFKKLGCKKGEIFEYQKNIKIYEIFKHFSNDFLSINKLNKSKFDKYFCDIIKFKLKKIENVK